MVITKKRADVFRMISSGLSGMRKSLYSLKRSIEPVLKKITKRNVKKLNKLTTATVKEIDKRRKRLRRFILSMAGRGISIPPVPYRKDIERISKKLNQLSKQITELKDLISKVEKSIKKGGGTGEKKGSSPTKRIKRIEENMGLT